MLDIEPKPSSSSSFSHGLRKAIPLLRTFIHIGYDARLRALLFADSAGVFAAGLCQDGDGGQGGAPVRRPMLDIKPGLDTDSFGSTEQQQFTRAGDGSWCLRRVATLCGDKSSGFWQRSKVKGETCNARYDFNIAQNIALCFLAWNLGLAAYLVFTFAASSSNDDVVAELERFYRQRHQGRHRRRRLKARFRCEKNCAKHIWIANRIRICVRNCVYHGGHRDPHACELCSRNKRIPLDTP